MTEHTEAHRARRRAHAEAALARYPDISPEILAELTTWFRREASALDVGLIASNEELAKPYRRFRAEQIDPLRPRDWVKGTLFALVVALAIIAILWRAF